jgi:antibiotic biosynthesis monooxygenase (ABM) superfamily enzyme
MSQDRYVRIVSLWIHPGKEAAFEEFERQAAANMARHGGRIERAIRVSAAGDDAPFEIHVVSFPDRAAADAYAIDAATQELRLRRPEIITRTEVLEGREAGPYGA